jgi:DNA-binding HxlR family transcriptional regulator
LLSTNKKVSMRKQDSTNARNEAVILRNCGMAYALGVIGGRWKPAILFNLLEGRMRYNELRKAIPAVSERMLVAQLRELEEHGLVKRTVFQEVPPRVEYELTELGQSTAPMLQCISDWGNMHRQKDQAVMVQ